jgi:hypothetical protein
MPLFEVAVLEKPTKDAQDHGAQERLVLGPVSIVAPNPEVAKILIGKNLPATVNGMEVAPDRLEVLVRPFLAR